MHERRITRKRRDGTFGFLRGLHAADDIVDPGRILAFASLPTRMDRVRAYWGDKLRREKKTHSGEEDCSHVSADTAGRGGLMHTCHAMPATMHDAYHCK